MASNVPIMRFEADSPFFSGRASDLVSDFASLESFLSQLIVQSRELIDFQTKAALAMQKVSTLCGDFQRRQWTAATIDSSKHNELATLFKYFSTVSGDLVGAQEMLAESLTNAFVQPLENFSRGPEFARVHELKQSYTNNRGIFDIALGRYLQSESTATAKKQGSLFYDIKAIDVVRARKDLEVVRFDLCEALNDLDFKTNIEVSEAVLSSILCLRTSARICSDLLESTVNNTSEVALRQQTYRTLFASTKTLAKRMRGDIEATLNSMLERCELQMPNSASDIQSPLPNDTNGGGRESLSGGGGGEQRNSLSSFFRRSTTNVSSTSKPNPMPDSSPTSPGSCSIGISETETRMKALDSSELSSLFTPIAKDQHLSASIVKQGYVWTTSVNSKKGAGSASPWYRQWLVLDESKLYSVKEQPDVTPSSLETKVLCVCELASVRDRSSELPFSFEINSNLTSFSMQAEGAKELLEWNTLILKSIEKRLVEGVDPHMTYGKAKSSSSNSLMEREIRPSRRKENAEIIERILAKNAFCCDCGSASPEWCSLQNLAIICITCCGVHRSLGVQISKVRSLRLDDMEPEEYALFDAIDNEKINSIFEHSPIAALAKPVAGGTAGEREAFIRSKYVLKAFCEESDRAQQCLLEAISNNDIVSGLRSIAQGANTSAKELVNEGEANSLLQIAATKAHPLMVCLLILNSADLSVYPFDCRSPNSSLEYIEKKATSAFSPSVASPISPDSA